MAGTRSPAARFLGGLLIAIGVGLVVYGLWSGLTDDESVVSDTTTTTATTAPATTTVVSDTTTTTATTAPATTTVGSDTTTTTAAVDPLGPDAIAAFFDDWAAAIRAGDAVFLFERLHPAVLDRYGPEACTAYTATIESEKFSVAVDTIGARGTVTYQTDGRTAEVTDAVGVTVARSDIDATSDANLALHEGTIRWFTDCGDPLP